MDKFQLLQQKSEELRKTAEEILKYSQMEGSEVGEYWQTLHQLFHSRDMMPPKFKEAYEEELVRTLKEIKENYVITEHVETYTRVLKDLEYIGE